MTALLKGTKPLSILTSRDGRRSLPISEMIGAKRELKAERWLIMAQRLQFKSSNLDDTEHLALMSQYFRQRCLDFL